MLNALSVRSKFLILVAIPLLAIIYLDGKQIMDDYATEKAMGQVVQLAELTKFSNVLIHEVQKERGYSAGFAASKGRSFAESVRSQRVSSRQAADKLRDQLEIFTKNVPESATVVQQYRPAQDRLAQLDATHKKIDSFDMSPVEIITFYTGMVRDLQAALGAAQNASTDLSLYARINNLMDLISAKEFAGQERATLNAVFSANTFSNELYRGWVERAAKQAAFLQAFLENANPDLRVVYTNTVMPLQRQVEAFRNTAFANQDKPTLDVDPSAWFAASTAYIDALHEVELAAGNNLQQMAATMQAEAQRSFTMSIVSSVLLVGITLLLTLLVVRNVTIPLAATVRFARQVAEGDLSATLRLNRSDELGKLAVSLNIMLGSLKNIIQKAESATAHAHEQAELAVQATAQAEVAQRRAEHAKLDGMSDAADLIEIVAGKLCAISGEISNAIVQAGSGAQDQSHRLSSTAAAMEEMTCTVVEVARSSGSAVHSADSTREHAQEGRKVVHDVSANIAGAMQRGRDLKEAMNQLGNRVQNVDKVLRVISDIADQTNLLALNAAIEAARAGDAGRGFAVVADEVRKLAEKTMEATREVGTVLSGIRGDTEQNIRTVDETVLAMEKTTELTQRSGEALDTIVGMVDKTTDRIRSIATAAEEQSATSEEINRSVMDVSALAEDTARAMEHATDSVLTLQTQVQDLQKLIITLRAG